MLFRSKYVTSAKLQVYGEVDIDMPAGPSELLIIADSTAKASWVAADFLSQLEHGEDSQSIAVTFSVSFAKEVVSQIEKQIKQLSRRKIIKSSLKNSFVIVVSSIKEACLITNQYSPEHLEIIARNKYDILKNITNVGSVFLGKYTSEVLGDYTIGTNHTLPTSGYAKMFSPLSIDSFGKMIQVQQISKQGIKKLRRSTEILAKNEGLDAHKNAITIRFYD